MFVRNFVDIGKIYFAIRPYHNCKCAIEQRVAQYLVATDAQVVPLYEPASGDPAPFTKPIPAELRFAIGQLILLVEYEIHNLSDASFVFSTPRSRNPRRSWTLLPRTTTTIQQRRRL